MFLNDLSDFCRSSKDTKKVSAVVEGGMNCMYFYFFIKCPNLFYRKVISPTTPPFVQNAWTLRPVCLLFVTASVFHSPEAASPQCGEH